MDCNEIFTDTEIPFAERRGQQIFSSVHCTFHSRLSETIFRFASGFRARFFSHGRVTEFKLYKHHSQGLRIWPLAVSLPLYCRRTIHIEYQSFCQPSEWVPLPPKRVCPRGGDTHMLAGEGVGPGGTQFRRLDRNSVTLYSLIPLRGGQYATQTREYNVGTFWRSFHHDGKFSIT
jgi:hypothetical protein